MNRFLNGALLGALSVTAAATSSCAAKGTYVNEKGAFSMSWCYPGEEDIEISFSISGTAFVGIGFGGSM